VVDAMLIEPIRDPIEHRRLLGYEYRERGLWVGTITVQGAHWHVVGRGPDASTVQLGQRVTWAAAHALLLSYHDSARQPR
jgi:hypothetical protein